MASKVVDRTESFPAICRGIAFESTVEGRVDGIYRQLPKDAKSCIQFWFGRWRDRSFVKISRGRWRKIPCFFRLQRMKNSFLAIPPHLSLSREDEFGPSSSSVHAHCRHFPPEYILFLCEQFFLSSFFFFFFFKRARLLQNENWSIFYLECIF